MSLRLLEEEGTERRERINPGFEQEETERGLSSLSIKRKTCPGL
jgi:hypothetical protein